ncbi:Transcription factor TFIIIB component B [Bulinus truncatus]|nr:Transcription factor TFIIIB component B [Bulinus truncatus]
MKFAHFLFIFFSRYALNVKMSFVTSQTATCTILSVYIYLVTFRAILGLLKTSNLQLHKETNILTLVKMSTLTEMSPCNFEQGKAEAAKGITRRPRLVMKPNIRPGPGKPVSAAPKPKPAKDVTHPVDASPSVGKSSQCLNDSTTLTTEKDIGKDACHLEEGLKSPTCNIVKENSAEVAKEIGNNPLDKTHSTSAAYNEKSGAKIITSCDENDDQLPQLKATDSSDKLEKASDPKEKLASATSIIDDEKDGASKTSTETDVRDTASECDASSVSECISLEADKDRRDDVDDEVKKLKRRRTKKHRAEPLPSREKSPDRQRMKMSDLLSWNPQQNFLPKKVKKKVTISASPEQSSKADEDTEISNQSASLPAPQVMIGPDGSVVLNTESLLIQSVPDENKLPEAIEEDDDDRYLNTNSYRKHKKTKFWTEDETERFFLGLSMCGTDFSLMTNLLTDRSRRELKNKFHREERRSRPLIDKALANRKPYDPTPFAEMIAAEEEKANKLAKKKIEVKAIEKKEKKSRKTKMAKKRKKSDSENEEDDWGPEHDEDDDLVENIELEVPVKRKKKIADKVFPPFKETSKQKKMETVEAVPPQPVCATQAQEVAVQDSNGTKAARRITSLGTESIQSIPGSSQVQIEMEGLTNPVQGVLIPKSMIPLIAPHLGIQDSTSDYQILLVQEQSASGNLVHVYIIPDSEKKDGHSHEAAAKTAPAISLPHLKPQPGLTPQNSHSLPITTSSKSVHPLVFCSSSATFTDESVTSVLTGVGQGPHKQIDSHES